MITLIAAAAVTQALDLISFAPAVARWGPGGEANPVIARIYDTAGFAGVAGFKAALFTLLVITLNAMAAHGAPSWLTTTILIFAIAMALLGTLTNIWASLL